MTNSARPVALEEFGAECADTGVSGGPKASPDYLAGFEDGVKAGQYGAEQDQARLQQALINRIEDISFTHAEARLFVMERLAPLFRQLVDGLIPSMVAEAFTMHVQSAITAAAKEACDQPLHLFVPLAQQEALSESLADTPGIVIAPDPDLSPDQVRLDTTRNEILIDLDALTLGLQDALLGLALNERDQHHG